MLADIIELCPQNALLDFFLVIFHLFERTQENCRLVKSTSKLKRLITMVLLVVLLVCQAGAGLSVFMKLIVMPCDC